MKKFLVVLLLLATCHLPLATGLYGQSASPSSLTFPAGPLSISESGTLATTFTNTSTVTISAISVTVGGTNSADFSVTTSPATNCGGSLATGATCTLTATFTPGGLGSRAATISISWTGNAFSPFTVFLAGYGQAAAGPPAGTAALQALYLPNDTSTGTTLFTLTKISAAGNAIKLATTDNRTGVAVGIVNAGAGTSGSAVIVEAGQVPCVFDGATTNGDFVTVSTTTAGDCKDFGANPPFDGSQLIGRVNSTNAAGGTYALTLLIMPPGASGFGTITTNGTAVAAGTAQAQPTVTFTGLTTSSRCVATVSGALPATWQTGIALLCAVTANTATVSEVNGTAASITPASVTLNVAVF